MKVTVSLRGGYGSNYLLEFELEKSLSNLKCVIGFSDLTTLQIFLWQRCNWITFYGPMVAAGLNAGSGARNERVRRVSAVSGAVTAM